MVPPNIALGVRSAEHRCLHPLPLAAVTYAPQPASAQRAPSPIPATASSAPVPQSSGADACAVAVSINIRELRNVVERNCYYSLSEVTVVEDLPTEIAGFRTPMQSGYEEQITACKRQLLIRALEETGNHQKEAAQKLHLSYDQLRHQVRTFLRIADFSFSLFFGSA